MRFYNLEETLFDDRDFSPALPELRNAYGIPVVLENPRVLETRFDFRDGVEPLVAGLAA